MSATDPTSVTYERAVSDRWGARDPKIRSFWQSPTVAAEINRRITGDATLTPTEYFARRYCSTPRRRALSIGCGDGGRELAMLRLGVCEHLVGVDLSADRLERARRATPPGLSDRLELVCANVESWRPRGQFDLVIAVGALHHVELLERFFDQLEVTLTDDGLLYVDEFVGPSRFQWTDKQLGIVNRLLDRLSPSLRHDLVEPELGPRPSCTRPSIAGLIAADPSESARSAEIPKLLHSRLETVEERPYGGGIFHLFFNRIMGNFEGHDDLVRVLMELDAILTDEGVIGSDYLWGVYRLPEHRLRVRVSGSHTDGRLEAIEGQAAVGWAADHARPGRRVSVDVYVDHKLIGKTVADLPRADLASEGFGDGEHGFGLGLPDWLLDGQQHTIPVMSGSRRATLPPARGWAQRNRAVPDGTRFAWTAHDPTLPPVPTTRVLAGREGWAFPCDDAVGSIEQMLGRLCLTDTDLDDFRAAFEQRSGELAALGIPYVVAIAPTKASVHPERLPDSSPMLGSPTLARQLNEALEGAGIRCVDLLSRLRKAAQTGRQLYYKLDPDWNYEGALIAAQGVIEAISKTGVAVEALDTESVVWVSERFQGLLAGRPAVALQDGQLVGEPPTAAFETARRPDEAELGLRRAPAPEVLTPGGPVPNLIERPESMDRPSALVLHDPCGRHLEPFLGACFSRSMWVPGRRSHPAVIEAIRPAVVIQILDESRTVQVPYDCEL
jgi:SAM-dependent methyltransferase